MSFSQTSSTGQRKTRTLEADFESLHAGDISLTQSTLTYGQSTASREWQLSVASKTFNVNYQPVSFDIFGYETEIDKTQEAIQGSWRSRFREDQTLFLGAGYTEGFSSFQTLWLDQYYFQQFSFFPEFQKSSPNSINLSTGWRWEYLPASGFLQMDLSWIRDQIAPGYEIDFDGLHRGRSRLNVNGLRISSENILSSRIRTLHEIQINDTTDRELRYNYQGSTNFAIGEHWISRLQFGWTRERPSFDAWYGGTTLEYHRNESFQMYLNGSFYRDTGEIENALFSSAAPGKRSTRLGFGLRWSTQDSRHRIKLYLGRQQSRYDPFGLGTAFFEGLYKDRNWTILQTAYQYTF